MRQVVVRSLRLLIPSSMQHLRCVEHIIALALCRAWDMI